MSKLLYDRIASFFRRSEKTKLLRINILLLIGATFIGCTEKMKPLLPVTDTFDDDTQGWKINAAGKGGFQAAGGNPGGFVYAEDQSIDTWFFIAPNQFVEISRKMYGLTLSFDLMQSATDAQTITSDDIVLTDGTIKLTYNTPNNPGISWTSYSVKLNETSGWKKGKVNATQADMQQVLQNLTSLRIRGEFRLGPDRGGIDNVSIH